MKPVRLFTLFICLVGISLCQDREANYTIRFEPTAILQTNADIPFEIHVTDDLHKPVMQAKVRLQIDTAEHDRVQVFRATETEPGVYVAKPVFPISGRWNAYVEVHKNGLMAARTIEQDVPGSSAK